jgi:hypothetical protein
MKETGCLREMVLVIVATIILSVSMPFQHSLAQSSQKSNTNTVDVYTNDSKPYGNSYGGWTAKWWIWLLSIPSTINPAIDSSGVNCAQKQAGPVWYLAGSTTGKADRSCTIPAGKAILFPILNSECSYVEYPKLKTETELRSCAVAQNDQTHIETTVDGVGLQSSQMPRVQSPIFNFTFPANNIGGSPAGPSQSVADGFYVFLHPLSPGKHDIAFKAVNIQFTTTGTNTIAQNIVYHLTVQ